MKLKRFGAWALTLSMVFSTIVPAYAAETNEVVDPLPGTGYSKITVEVKDTSGGGGGTDPDNPDNPDNPDIPPVDPTDIIIATVPVELPIIMDLEGNITVPTDAKIINHVKDKGIKVTAIEAELANGWQAVNFDDDFEAKADNIKELGMAFRGDKLGADGTFSITADNWNIAKNGSLPLNMQAKLPKQTEESKVKVATIGFSLDWSGLDGDDGGSGGTEEPDISVLKVEYDNGLMLPGSKNTAIFKWDSTTNAELANVVSDNPDVADVSDIVELASYSGEKSVTVVAKAKGEATFSGTLSTGETGSFKVVVSKLADGSDPSAEVKPDKNFNEGETLTPGDITVTIPVENPDGNKDIITVTPDTIPDEPLKPGDNDIEVTVDVNGVRITIHIVITIKSSNPSNGTNQTIDEAKAIGFSFASFEDGLEITGFENKQFKSEVNIPEQIGDFKVLKIGNNVFKGQTNIKKITMPDTVKAIGTAAFSGCSGLTDILLPDKLETMDGMVFNGCTGLTEIKLPDNLKSMGARVFYSLLP